MKSTYLLVTLGFCASLCSADLAFAQTLDMRSVPLVRQDTSDCSNADVSAQEVTRLGGTAIVLRTSSGSGSVRVTLGGQPSTTYHFFLKCVRLLGDITTDTDGAGTGFFRFGAGETGAVLAFDVRPEGDPPGNIYQSVQVNFDRPQPPVPPHIDYVSQTGNAVTFAYEGLPAGAEIAVVNVTFGTPTVGAIYPVSPLGMASADITITGEGMYYLLARLQADQSYIAQTIEFYIQ